MDTFAETAIIDYRLLFADQGKQTSVFRLKKKQKKLKFAVSVCSKQREVATFH
jgi:hypothetical protein